MLKQLNKTVEKVASMNDTTAMIGHIGLTYGYHSESGYMQNLNYSISLIVDNDYDYHLYPGVPFCLITQVIYKNLYGSEIDLGCPQQKKSLWSCNTKRFAEPTCYIT